MKFNFFTFGGAFFWEDVFFYQKWRIQRHCGTKTYRLLDSWDIRRASGTFEECQKAFIKYIDRYEITKQQGKLIVLLHGYLDGKNIFKPLWRKLVLTNATVAAINYPSLFSCQDEQSEENVRHQFAVLLEEKFRFVHRRAESFLPGDLLLCHRKYRCFGFIISYSRQQRYKTIHKVQCRAPIFLPCAACRSGPISVPNAAVRACGASSPACFYST